MQQNEAFKAFLLKLILLHFLLYMFDDHSKELVNYLFNLKEL